MLALKSPILLLTCLLLATSVASSAAQNKGAAKLGGAFLNIGGGPRAVGMGEAFGAVADDVNAVYWNPAGLVQIEGNQISFMHNEWAQDINYEFLEYSQKFLKGRLGGSLVYINAGSFEKRDEWGLLLPDKFTPYGLVSSLSYAQSWLTPGFSLGGSLKVINENIDNDSVYAVALDIGSLYRVSDRLKVGLSIQNLGTPIKGFSLPLNIKAGVCYKLLDDKLTLATDINLPKDNKESLSLGVEYWHNILAFRLGYKYKINGNDDIEGLTGLSAGIGFNIKDSQLDYAWVPYGDIGNTHRVSAIYHWGRERVPVANPPVPKEEPPVVEVIPAPPTLPPKIIPILLVFAQPGIFFPDGKGVDDTTTFHFRFTEDYEVEYWVLRISITSKDGKSVRTFSGKRMLPFDQIWDGKDDEGKIVPKGTYFYTLNIKDREGNEYFTTPQEIIVY